MAKLKFLGIAQAIAQVTQISLGGTWSAGETARLTINGKFVEYVAQSGDTPTLVAAGLQSLASLSSEPEFRELEFTVFTTTITATGPAGVPFTLSVSEGSASGTIAATTPTNATGPNHWNNPVNWSTGSVPVNGDEVFIESDSAIIRYGFATSLTLAKLEMRAGQVGLPDVNASGYSEYRPTYLTVSAAIVLVQGGDLVRISTESANTVVTCQATGVVDLKVNHASAQVFALRGTVRMCRSSADVGQAALVSCSSAALELGPGFTAGSIVSAGRTTIEGTVTTLTVEEDYCVLHGSATTIDLNGGTLSHESAATITTVNQRGGLFELRNDIRPKTITTYNLFAGQLSNPHQIVTFTNGITPSADLLQAG